MLVREPSVETFGRAPVVEIWKRNGAAGTGRANGRYPFAPWNRVGETVALGTMAKWVGWLACHMYIPSSAPPPHGISAGQPRIMVYRSVEGLGGHGDDGDAAEPKIGTGNAERPTKVPVVRSGRRLGASDAARGMALGSFPMAFSRPTTRQAMRDAPRPVVSQASAPRVLQAGCHGPGSPHRLGLGRSVQLTRPCL